MIESLLESLRPDQHALFQAISRHITDDMLDEISRADYGQDAEKHLQALRRLRDTGDFIQPMHWYPCEALELIRSSQPDDPLWRPGSTGTRGHWMRAFASAALLRALGPPWNYQGDAAKPSYNLIQLICSLRAFPIDLTLEAVRMVAWLMLRSDLEESDPQPVYFGVGLLWLALHLAAGPTDDQLICLSDWIVGREAELHRKATSAFDRWLLGIGNDPPPSRWEMLGRDFLLIDLQTRAPVLQDWVKLIGGELAGTSLE